MLDFFEPDTRDVSQDPRIQTETGVATIQVLASWVLCIHYGRKARLQVDVTQQVGKVCE
jgi:hypothetical protein